MKKFKFSLEKVLKLRRDEEKEAILEYKNAEIKLTDGIKRLGDLCDERFASQKNKYSNNFMLKQNIHYQGLLLERIKKQEDVNEKLKESLREKKEILRGKNIEKKSLEKLKEIKLNEYRMNMEKIDMQKNDEFATTSYYLKTLKGGE